MKKIVLSAWCLVISAVGANAAALPNGYVELEYIESTGTQYIDTGYTANANTRVEFDSVMPCPNDQVNKYTSPFGARCGDSKSYYYLAMYPQMNKTANSKMYYTYNEECIQGTTDFPFGERVTCVCDKDGMTWDGSMPGCIKTSVSALSKSYTTFFIFADNSPTTEGGSKAVDLVVMTLYSFKISEGGVLKRDFVPCRNPDGEVGLFDLVNCDFYGNAGTGKFNAGPWLSASAPSVEITKAWQKNPGSGVVDFTYAVGKLAGLPYDLKIKVGAEGCAKTETVTYRDVAAGTATTSIDYKALLGKAYPNVTLSAALEVVIVPRDEEGIDYTTDGVTFVPGDYCVVDLKTGNVIEHKNVQSAATFNADLYKTTKMAFRRVPAGKFRSSKGDMELSEFWIAVTETVDAQYNAIMGGETTDTKPKRYITFDRFRGGDWSNWDGTYANVPAPTDGTFVAKLNKIVSDAGFADRIDVCTQLQWERAARAGTQGESFITSGSVGDFAWYNGNSKGAVHSCGSKKPNAWGIYDVYGNLTEVGLDGVNDSNPTTRSDYMWPIVESKHVYCGGTYVNSEPTCASGYRLTPGGTGDGQYHGYRLIIRSGKW